MDSLNYEHTEHTDSLNYEHTDSLNYELTLGRTLHRKDGPAIERPGGEEEWYLNGVLHREGNPAIIRANGKKEWYVHGVRHREDEPAIIYPSGKLMWYLNGVLHREDGPAIICPVGSNSAAYDGEDRITKMKMWYLNGKRHRTNGPAIVLSNGHKEWYVDGQLHRENKPAIKYRGYKAYYNYGILHRKNGPAITCPEDCTIWDKTRLDFNIKTPTLPNNDGINFIIDLNANTECLPTLPTDEQYISDNEEEITYNCHHQGYCINKVLNTVVSYQPNYVDGRIEYYGINYLLVGDRSQSNIHNYNRNVQYSLDGSMPCSYMRQFIHDDSVTMNNVKSRIDPPPVIPYNKGYSAWYIYGKYHREDGPAIEGLDGYQVWYINGLLHKENDPAIIKPNGDRVWCLNGRIHNEKGYAIICTNGYKARYINGLLHAEHLPAVERPDGYMEFYIYGHPYNPRTRKCTIPSGPCERGAYNEHIVR